MNKRLTLLLLLGTALALLLAGCWNYRGLDQMNIVAGIAIDFNRESNRFHLTYEVTDLRQAKQEGTATGRLIEAEGNTLFDAARNAKRSEADKLYFGSAMVVVVSKEIATKIGLLRVLEWFLRDGECRETMCVALSAEDSAGEILKSHGDAREIVTETLHDIIREDRKITGSTAYQRLYEVYNAIKSKRNATILPVLRKTVNAGKKTCEVYGSAVFNGDRLAGFFDADESKYALLIQDDLGGGLFTLAMADHEGDDITLEILRNRTRKTYREQDGTVTVRIETKTNVAIAENQHELDLMDPGIVRQIEAAAAAMVESRIRNVVDKAQRKFYADLFGFGEMVYKKDDRLWQTLGPAWKEIYPTVRVEIDATVHAATAAFTK